MTALVMSASLPAEATLSVSKTSEVNRPSETVAEQISGVTWAGGSLYYAVDDSDRKLYPITLDINLETGALATSNITIGTGITVSGASDMEGCAFDPASGNVWVSDETGASIREIDPATGAALRSAPVPSIMKNHYGNYSLEALTISGDGLTMWTCNEEALKCDGTNSTKTAGSTVRLTRFIRESVYDNWTADGQWAYETQPVGSDPWIYNGSAKTRSGVSALTSLPNGNLLVLERTLTGDNAWDAAFYTRIYLVDVTADDGSPATDVSGLASLKEAASTDIKRVKKTALVDRYVGWVNYEGMCLGPRLSDGSTLLVLVSDAGNCTAKIMTMKLSGLDIRTVNFPKPDGGTPSIIGGPYRFTAGETVEVSIDGVEHDSAYTNNAAICTNVAWSAGSASGSSAAAAFTVSADANFEWRLNATTASSPIDNSDTFESYAAGALTSESAVGSWTGEAEVVALEYIPPDPPGYAMPKDTHMKVLDVENSASRVFSCTTNGNDRIDMTISVVRRSPEEKETFMEGAKVIIICAPDGRLMLRCRKTDGTVVWAALSDTKYSNGDWVRLSVSLDSTTNPGETYALVRINGEACMTEYGIRSPIDPTTGGAWHKILATTDGARINELHLQGSVKVDDVIKTTEEFEPELSPSTTTVDGVPISWLRENGLGLNPEIPIPGTKLRSMGYLLGDAYDVGIDPADDEPFAITDMTVLDDGRLKLAFNGVREDLSDYDRTSLYPVYRMETLGGSESAVSGSTKIVSVNESVKRTVWTSTSPIDETSGFYRVKVTTQR